MSQNGKGGCIIIGEELFRIDSGCGKGFNTTVGNNMINPEGATVTLPYSHQVYNFQIISQVGQVYANCTVDVSQLWEFPNGTLFNMTTT